MKLTKWKIGIAVASVAALVALYPYFMLFGTLAYDSIRERLHRIPFDSQAWQDPKQVESEDAIRIRMVDDLIDSKILDHRSRTEVEKLLGNKTRKEYFREYDLVYWLGPEREFLGIDSEWLAIKFDKNGIVSEYRIVRD